MGLGEIICWPFGWLMRTFYNFTNSYVIALLLFALVVKLVTLPLSIKQQKNQIKTARLRPKLAAIEQKYAGRTDRKTMEKKQQEIMEMQRAEGSSPMSGCLPLLIQLPIIILLYNIIRKPLTYICEFSEDIITALGGAMQTAKGLKAPVTDEIQILSFVNKSGGNIVGVEGAGNIFNTVSGLNFNLFNLDISLKPSLTFSPFDWLMLIPILVFVTSYLSMKISRKLMGSANLQQQSPDAKVSGVIMDLMMPLLSVFFAFSLPAALGLYWIYQSVISTLQQFILCKVMPLPTYTEEEIRAIRKAEKEQQKAREAASRAAANGNYRDGNSLHHIDDDDEDEADNLPKIKSKFDDDD